MKGRWGGSRSKKGSQVKRKGSPGVRSRERVTCYSTSPTGIPDHRHQHRRTDGLRSFFKRFSTSLYRRAAHATSRYHSPVSATTAIPQKQTLPLQIEKSRESRVIRRTVVIYINSRGLNDVAVRKFHLISDTLK